MTSPKPTGCPACAAGVWMPNCTYGEPDPATSVGYLEPVRAELAHLRAENATLADALDRRTRTQNATAETNDTLVRRVVELEAERDRVRALADRWEKYAATLDPLSVSNAASIAALATMKGAYQGCAEKIFAALDEVQS